MTYFYVKFSIFVSCLYDVLEGYIKTRRCSLQSVYQKKKTKILIVFTYTKRARINGTSFE